MSMTIIKHLQQFSTSGSLENGICRRIMGVAHAQYDINEENSQRILNPNHWYSDIIIICTWIL